MTVTLEGDAVAGGSLLLAIAAFFRSSWRRVRGGIDAEAKRAVEDLRDEVVPMLRQVLEETKSLEEKTAEARDRVTRLEAVVFDRTYRRRRWRILPD